MKIFKRVCLILVVMLFQINGIAFRANAQNTALKNSISKTVESSIGNNISVGKLGVKTVKISGKKIVVTLSDSYAYLPITQNSITELKKNITQQLPAQYKNYKVELNINGRDINKFISKVAHNQKHSHETFITPLGDNSHFSKGLSDDIIAMWQSHGWYFEPKLNRWEWQRARIFQTVEDIYTQSYVVPFLMPMLENAGAYVMSPRERDVNINEVIIDNDGGLAVNGYKEQKGDKKWGKGNAEGFAYNRKQYENFQNPFNEGTYRKVEATNKHDKVSTASWNAEMPEAGKYAVYVSYKTLPNSAPDAVYTINYKGGSKQFKVNQKMGGGTWIYLGHYDFDKGLQNTPIVELSNYSHHHNAVVTADAVKIGGGYGNIARIVDGMSENVKSSDNAKQQKIDLPNIDYKYQISNYPRFTEAARYFMQWAGVPDSVYTQSKNVNDYVDDYRSRGLWVNYLAGGSSVLPKRKGLNIPVDLAFAFHTDAGTNLTDTVIGTLGIYATDKYKNFADGRPRETSRALTEIIMDNIVKDIRATHNPNWTRRGMWDKLYSEAINPEVPTMLLELLSHQNFADMKHGLDPNFRFTVSRAIYKGMLQYLAESEGREYVVQPLPVNSFAITKVAQGSYKLTWKATQDTLSKDADPTKYIVMERIGNGGFEELKVTPNPYLDVQISDNDIHSYKIIALNEGGKSFPSEILSLGEAKNSKGSVIVVNGFTRVSAPDSFEAGAIAGFYDERDPGVPYMQDISYIGPMFEYRRDIPWMDDDAAGFGASRANYETTVIAGNTFDYPYVHGEAIMNAGYSFVSTSVQAVIDGEVKLTDYKILDLILGKQKEVKDGVGLMPNKYQAFPVALQNKITEYTANGGNIFVSGSFVATDIWDNNRGDENDKKFAQNVLGYNWRVGQASCLGKVYSVPTIYKMFKEDEFSFYTELNGDFYSAESPDSLYPSDTKGTTFMRYRENNLVAGIISNRDNYRTCVIGFPFETIKKSDARGKLMNQILEFFTQK